MSRVNCVVKLLTLTVLITVTLHFIAGASLSEFQSAKNERDYWLKRKEWFYTRTRFDLTDENLRLIGAKRLLFENKSAQPKGHLPFWFDYELFKRVFNKNSSRTDEEERSRHHTYINTCMRVLKARVLFRMLAGTDDTFITNDADRFDWELFGPVQQGLQNNDKREISFSIRSRLEGLSHQDPLDRAIRLVKHEMEIVESRNQVETNLRSFDETDGSAIKGKLPY